MNKRLFIISNRLPLTVEKNQGVYTIRQSSGGLISAISAYLNKDGKDTFTEKIWAGVPGCTQIAWDAAVAAEQADYNYLPVFVNNKKYDAYYNGFSNSLLWPLFHYFPSFAEYRLSDFQAYMDVNSVFAEKLSLVLKPDDVVWIHDYHLLPLAGMLRKVMPSVTIGFFLHIPFPDYELFRVIPKQWQRELITGMLGADLIGFHTIEYAAYFLATAGIVLKVKQDGQYLQWESRQIKADAFPISIDFNLFHQAYSEIRVSAIRQGYLKLKGDKQLLFSVDRLDYTKGILNRIKGYKKFLVQNPEYIGRVVFALINVPSRDGIKQYAEKKRIIDEYIGNLNSTMGSIDWKPVIYQYQHLEFEELIALYTTCDAAVITPLRDGMNLVAKEFVASRKDKKGVLILSEMAGAAKELTEALLINPNDTVEIADTIKSALEMNEQEQADRLNAMQERIARYDVNVWSADFFDQLAKVKSLQSAFEIKLLDNFAKVNLLNKYATAAKRLILLDYDGTLVPFSKVPRLALPSNELLQLLKQLADNYQNDVYIISGRDSVTLENWLGHLPVGLIAEHGAKMRLKGHDWETQVVDDREDYMRRIKELMNKYVSKCPHSFIEQKEFSIAWHYRNADTFQGNIRAKELFDALTDYTAQLPLNVLNGHKVIEVRGQEVNKGIAVAKVLKTAKYDFILCLGDDQTDEDMFKQLMGVNNAFTVKIGNQPSFATFNMLSPYQVQSLLQTIVEYPASTQTMLI